MKYFSSEIWPEILGNTLGFGFGIDAFQDTAVLLDGPEKMRNKAIPILIFLLFTPTLLSSAYAQPRIGEKTPGFITSTLDGKRIALKDYWEQEGKKVLVLSFFATWCQPCKEDLKYLQKIQDKNADKGLQVVAVLTQDTSKGNTVKEFM